MQVLEACWEWRVKCIDTFALLGLDGAGAGRAREGSSTQPRQLNQSYFHALNTFKLCLLTPNSAHTPPSSPLDKIESSSLTPRIRHTFSRDSMRICKRDHFERTITRQNPSAINFMQVLEACWEWRVKCIDTFALLGLDGAGEGRAREGSSTQPRQLNQSHFHALNTFRLCLLTPNSAHNSYSKRSCSATKDCYFCTKLFLYDQCE